MTPSQTSSIVSFAKESSLDIELSSQSGATTATPNTTPHPQPCTTHLVSHFLPTHPARPRYLLLRFLSITFSLLQITLVAIAASGVLIPSTPEDAPKKKVIRRWLDPCLSPAITAFIWCTVDVLSVFKWQRREHHIARALYDGLLAVGFCVSGGFFVNVAFWGVLREGVSLGVIAIAGMLLGCMAMETIVHSIFSVHGVRDWVSTRQAVRLANQTAGP